MTDRVRENAGLDKASPTKIRSASFYRKTVEAHCRMICGFEVAMDRLMAAPSSVERGKRVAELMNELTMNNQRVMHFGLGWSLKKIKSVQDRGGSPEKRRANAG